MIGFSSGPFSFDPASRGVTIRGVAQLKWTLSYGNQELAQRTLPAAATQDETREAFGDDVGSFIVDAKRNNAAARINLIDQESDKIIGCFFSDDSCGLTPGLIDDRSKYWLRSANRLYSRDVTLTEFATITAQSAALPAHWIINMLPDPVLTQNASDWRAPTAWEIRHVVGEGSFTGMSGARAAELVGVTAANFRKYTARDGASSRQAMSFAMWHLLLQKLGVQRA